MNSRKLLSGLVAASLGLSSLAFAQGNDRDRRGDDRQGYQQRGDDRQGYQQRGDDRQGYQQRDGDRRDGDGRGYSQRDYERDHRGDPRAMGNRGEWRSDNDAYHYGARGPEWRRGGHIPPEYRSRQYVVNDWRGHHLHAPPRGYEWVQVGNDYVLVAIASGIIAQLLINQ